MTARQTRRRQGYRPILYPLTICAVGVLIFMMLVAIAVQSFGSRVVLTGELGELRTRIVGSQGVL